MIIYNFIEPHNGISHSLNVDWSSVGYTVPPKFDNVELVSCVVKSVSTKNYFPVVYETLDVTLLAHRTKFLNIDWKQPITAGLDGKAYTFEVADIGYIDSGDYEEFTLSFTESAYKSLDVELDLGDEDYISVGSILT